MTYDELLIEAEELGIIVKEIKMRTKKGRCYGNRIAINSKLNNTEKACILAEELGHYNLTIGNILNQKEIENKKQELIARKYGFDRNVGLIGLIEAFKHGCIGRFEIAEYLDVTEEYLQEAIDYYRDKYGVMYQIDNYLIYFMPNLFIGKAF
ncbi:ImmA/IrrE family metallo-endopeptidase [Eubacterium multiforme]|uniref:IrrE N-terminal-like domain-containing protein n=1 Tax=Eubacterium multiforme TaxID=83339 RepID=A0ABT9UXZ5_9FIRM|nr:ImmA/IrrE family metallo-endopeptidase [Eubacterium multiforme]MDQ0151184.1 hypothetical protein [Eubacterium multiforme]